MDFHTLDPSRFADHLGEWVRTPGPEADVVVSCRARLARNVQGYPFVSRLEPDGARELCARMREILVRQRLDGETIWIEIPEASSITRLLLRERHLVSRDLAPGGARRSIRPGRAVAFGERETVSIMVNEEDHLRLQSMAAGFALESAWQRLRDVDVLFEGEVGYAVSPELGYLTGCPTNVGTGLRASVMLHLPALGLVRSELEKVFTAAQRTGLAVRGMYGEGSRAAGDYYQISNQVTLGRTEEQLFADLGALVPVIVKFERDVRGILLREQPASLAERVERSATALRTSRSLATEVALLHLSNLRLGACLGLSAGISPVEIDQVAIQIQKGHLHVLSGVPATGELAEPTERDRMRAAFLRRRFAAP
ncbi:MAG: ATP--guanido phosphotransferase [Planctomycetota bacterium]